ncbi:hypothetical protein [Streptomyces sp. NPDC002540]
MYPFVVIPGQGTELEACDNTLLIAEHAESYDKVFDCADAMPQLPEVPDPMSTPGNRPQAPLDEPGRHLIELRRVLGRLLWEPSGPPEPLHGH